MLWNWFMQNFLWDIWSWRPSKFLGASFLLCHLCHLCHPCHLYYFLALTLLLTNLPGLGERMPEKTLGRWRGELNFSCLKRTNMPCFGNLGKLFLLIPAISCINISAQVFSKDHINTWPFIHFQIFSNTPTPYKKKPQIYLDMTALQDHKASGQKSNKQRSLRRVKSLCLDFY